MVVKLAPGAVFGFASLSQFIVGLVHVLERRKGYSL
jgi:hypothetical protein